MKNKSTITLSALVIILFISTFSLSILYATEKRNNAHLLSSKKTQYSFMIEDAKEKSKNENISIFYFQRGGAYTYVQEIIDMLLQKQFNPDKEIYVAFNDSTNPNTTTGWTSDFNWDATKLGINIINESVGESHAMVDFQMLEKFEKEVLEEHKQIDLYTDSLSEIPNNGGMISRTKENIRYIDSWTFVADGTQYFNFEEQFSKNTSKYNYKDVDKSTKILDSFIDTDEPYEGSSLEANAEMISLLFPVLETENIEITYLGLTEDIYKNKENITRASTPNFETAMLMMNDEQVDKLIDLVGLNDYVTSYKPSQIGKNNFVISGNLVQDKESQQQADANKIVDVYNEQNDAGVSNINILYKPHPRSTDQGLEKMVEIANQMIDPSWTSSDDSIAQVIPKSIQYEFYALTGQFSDDEATGTYYYQYLTGTSTVVPALYDFGIKSDSIVRYYVSSEEDLNTLHKWYDGTGIVDFDKVVIT